MKNSKQHFFDIFLPANIIANISNDKEYDIAHNFLETHPIPHFLHKKGKRLIKQYTRYLNLLEKQYNEL